MEKAAGSEAWIRAVVRANLYHERPGVEASVGRLGEIGLDFDNDFNFGNDFNNNFGSGEPRGVKVLKTHVALTVVLVLAAMGVLLWW